MLDEETPQHDSSEPDDTRGTSDQLNPEEASSPDSATQQSPALETIALLAENARRARQFWSQMLDSPIVQMGSQIAAQLNSMQATLDLVAQPWVNLQTSFSGTVFANTWRSAQVTYELLQNYVGPVQELQALYNDLVSSETMQSYQRMLESYRVFTSPYVDLVGQISNNIDWVAVNATIATLTAAMEQARDSQEYRAHFEQSFANDLLARLNDVDTAPSLEEKEQHFLSVLRWLQERIKELPPSRIISYVLLSLLIPMILAQALNEYRALPQEQQHREEMLSEFDQINDQMIARDEQNNERNERLSLEIQALGDQMAQYQATVEALEDRTQYGVVKPVVVRVEASSKSRCLTTLQPGSLIEVIDQEGQWLYVDYFDYIDGDLDRGWVYKRNLVLVEP